MAGGYNCLSAPGPESQFETQLRSHEPDEAAEAFVHAGGDAIAVISLEGIVQAWSPGAERIFGYQPGEISGHPISLLTPRDRAPEERLILACIRRGECAGPFDTVRMRKDGGLVHVSLAVSPVLDARGRVTSAAYVAREVTDPAYQHLTATLAAIVESSDDAIVGKTLDAIIQTWNKGAEALYGYTADEAIGQSMMLLLPADRQEEETEILARIRNGERVDHFDTIRVRKDGTRVRVSLTISPVRDGYGRVAGASHIARNITEKSQLEAASAHYAAMVEFSEDAIVSKNLDGIILTWNPGAERIYGYSAAEALGCPMSMLLPPDRGQEETEILERLKRGERVHHFETVRVRKDRRLIDVSLTISPVFDKNGVIRGASHVARDITERKALERQFLHTQKLESLGVLAGGVAHDFNNLLTGILANAGTVADVLPDGGPSHTILMDVIQAAERASGLTRQLLAFAGKGRFTIEPVNLSHLIREISRLIQTSIPRKVQLKLDLREDIPSMEADAGQLQQVIMNLVINAAEAIGDRPGTVVISTGVQEVDDSYIRTIWSKADLQPGRYVALEVNDNGCGMDNETLEKIFDPFFTTKFAGRGLGLAAVLGIVRGHKGALKVYSAPGQGSTFKLFFPAGDVAALPVRPQAPAEELRGTGTVLVVDDEEIIRRTAKNALERYGYRVLWAEDGQKAVEVFRAAGEIALVLLDLTMPTMNGEETLRELQAIRPSIPVLLSSGFNEVEAVRRFTGKGLAGFIQKPYTSAGLATKVKRALKPRD